MAQKNTIAKIKQFIVICVKEQRLLWLLEYIVK
jgi:hypothetical protein